MRALGKDISRCCHVDPRDGQKESWQRDDTSV
jgi:hypothetical protein